YIAHTHSHTLRSLPASPIGGNHTYFFFFSSRRRHTRFKCDWSSDVCSSDLFGPCVTSKETFWPSLRVLKPCIWIAEKCAKRSSLPSSGVMNPYPFASLNHFTVPVAMRLLASLLNGWSPANRLDSRPARRTWRCRILENQTPTRVLRAVPGNCQ